MFAKRTTRTWITSGSIAAIGLAVLIAAFLPPGSQSQPQKAFRLERQMIPDAGTVITVPLTNVVSDYIRLKYAPAQPTEFHVTSSQPMAILIRATGTQIRTDAGWKVFSEEPRSEIWRLKPGVTRQMFVERPLGPADWRAYVLYGTEMKGLRLLMAQLREAWLIRSFSNWTGQRWGGGHFSGNKQRVSEEFSEPFEVNK